MTNSNLSKIKPKLRTTGQVTGNFGRPKTRTNGNSQLGYTTKENINMLTSKEDYIEKMYQILDTTGDQKIRNFAYSEIKKYMIQTGRW
jgi:hypothetical protein